MSITKETTAIVLTNEDSEELLIRRCKDNHKFWEIITDGFSFEKTDAEKLIIQIAGMCSIDLEIS